MKTFVLVVHILVAVILITLILLQTSKGGLSSGFGGGEHFRSKRGAERIVFIFTIVASVLFFITSVVSLLIRQ